MSSTVDPKTIEPIRARLKLVGPGPATMFADACELMTKPDEFGSTTHLIAHLLREVLSSLEEVLYAVSGPSDLQQPPTISLADTDAPTQCDVAAAKANPANSSNELSAVGLWYATRRFALDWADQQLREVCGLGIGVFRTAPVFERLAERARTDRGVAFDLTAQLLDRAREEWELHVARKHIRAVLGAALADHNLRLRAEEVVNRLAARGHGEFEDLLSAPG